METTIQLNSGYKIPILGFGTFLANGKEVEEAVVCAIKNGYRHIDTASGYNNQVFVGNGIKRCIDEGIVKRDDLFVTTKLWTIDWQPARIEKAIHQCLKDLQLDYLDMYMLHTPYFFNMTEEDAAKPEGETMFNYTLIPSASPKYRLGYNVNNLRATWTKMEELVDRGLVRSLGVSKFTQRKFDDLLSFCRIPPVTNQIELHPYLQQWELLEYCKKHDICLTAYYPLGGAVSMIPGKENLLENDTICRIALKHGKSAAQVLIRWCIQRGVVCIPKSVHAERIISNYDVFDFVLSEEEMKEIRAMDLGRRVHHAESYVIPPTSWKEVWDGEYVNE